MTDTMPRVGLDVHANQTHLFSLDLASGEFERKRIEGPPTKTLPHLQALGPRSIAVYEAGPTGSVSPVPARSSASISASPPRA